MLLTIIIIAIALAIFAVTAYLMWCQYVQRDQAPGRHRPTHKKTTGRRTA